MKKNKILNLILSLTLIFSMLLTLFGCDLLKDAEDVTQSDTDSDIKNITEKNIEDKDNVNLDYKVIEKNGEYHIIFDDISKYTYVRVDGEFGETQWWINFQSTQEMQNVILNGKLKDFHKKIIVQTFGVNGDVIIPNLFIEVTHPLSYKKNEKVTLLKGRCSRQLYFKSFNDYALTCQVITNNYFEAMLSPKFMDLKNQNNAETYYKSESSNEQTAKSYKKSIESIESLENIIVKRYILSNFHKTMFIEKTYNNNNIFKNVQLFANVDNDKYFEVNLNFQNTFSEEDLTDEFLFGFDVEAVERT